MLFTMKECSSPSFTVQREQIRGSWGKEDQETTRVRTFAIMNLNHVHFLTVESKIPATLGGIQ